MKSGGELQIQSRTVFILTFRKCTMMCMRRYACNDILYTSLALSLLILTITCSPRLLTIYYRSLPLDLRLMRLSCDIDDNSGRDCNSYLRSITEWSHCVVDIKFGYTIINGCPACVDIKDFKAKIGPYPMSILAFDDVVCCGNRRICHGGI